MTFTEADPVFPPKQLILVEALAVTDNAAAGCVIVKFCTDVHPLTSVIVQVHEPAVNPVTDAVPSPVGVPGVQS